MSELSCPLTPQEIRVLTALGGGEEKERVAHTLEESGISSTDLFERICIKLRVPTLIAAGMLAVAEGWVKVLPLSLPPKPIGPNPLTVLERTALRHVLFGANTQETARRMERSSVAVQSLWRYARQKIGITSNTRLAAQLADKWGWL